MYARHLLSHLFCSERTLLSLFLGPAWSVFCLWHICTLWISANSVNIWHKNKAPGWVMHEAFLQFHRWLQRERIQGAAFRWRHWKARHVFPRCSLRRELWGQKETAQTRLWPKNWYQLRHECHSGAMSVLEKHRGTVVLAWVQSKFYFLLFRVASDL